MSRQGLLAVVTAAAVLVSGAGPAMAQPEGAPAAIKESRKVIGILDIRVDGLSGKAAEMFEAELESQLDTDRYWVGTRTRMQEMLAGSLKYSPGCMLGPCLQEVRSQTFADLVILAYLQAIGSSYRYVITLLRTDTGAVVEQVADGCGVCTLSEAISQASLATIELVNNAPDSLEGLESNERPLVLPVVPDRRRAARRALTVAGLVTSVAGLAAAGTGLYLLSEDRDRTGYMLTGAGVGLAAGALGIWSVRGTF